MFTRVQPGVADGKPAAPAKAPMHKPMAPPAKTAPAGAQPEDHKGAIQKMHPEHLHRLVKDAHAGKFGPEAQKSAQQAMQGGAPQGPGAPQEGEQPEGAQPNYAGMFGGGGAQNDNDADDQPVPAGQMFGGR